MNADARKALSTIRRCIAAERFRLTEHFIKRLDDRGLLTQAVRERVNQLLDALGEEAIGAE